MLQRLIYKPPIPLEPVPKDNIIFGKDGEIKPFVASLCTELNIDPEEIIPKTLEDFYEKDITTNIQILRYNEYEIQRRGKQETIRNLTKQYIKSRKTGLSINKESNSRSIHPYSVVASTKEGISEQFIDNLPRIRKARTPTTFPTKMDLPQSLGKKGELDGERVYTKMSEKNAVHTLSSQGNAHANIRREDEFFSGRKNRGNLLINNMRASGDEEEDAVKSLLYDNFKKQMRYRLMHRERYMNASVIVTQKEEEFREKVKEEYLEREKRWLEKKKKLMMAFKDNKKNRDKRNLWKVHLREEQEAVLKKQFDLQEKLANSEKKRKEESDKKNERIKERNKLFQQKHQSIIEKIETEEKTDVPSYLQEIEKKFIESQERKDRFIQEKKTMIFRSTLGAEEKLRKVQEKKEEKDFQRLQKIGIKLEKLEKVKLKTFYGGKKMRGSSYDKARIKKLEEIRKQQEDSQRQLLEEFHEKEKRTTGRLREKKSSLDEYIAERREVWRLRTNHRKMNMTMIEGEYNKWLDNSTNFYRTRVDQIQKEKDWKNQHFQLLEKVDMSVFKDKNELNNSEF